MSVSFIKRKRCKMCKGIVTKGVALLLCLVMVLGMSGCYKTRQSQTDTTKSASDDLILYYIDNSAFQGTLMLLGWYRMQPEALKIEAIGFASAEELEEAMEEETPDIILLDKVTGGAELEPFQWIEQEKLAGLNDFLAQDADYDENNYITGVMDAGKYGDEQYILPLSVSSQYLLVNEAELGTGTLSALGESTTAQRLMEELIREAQLHEDELYFTHVPFYVETMMPDQWIYEMLEQTGALHVDHQDQKVIVDEAQFERTMEYMQVVLEDQNRMYQNGAELATADFIDIEDYCTSVLTDRNAPLMVRYMGSASHQLLGEDMFVLPYQLEEGGYVQSINVMGMVGADSTRQKEAYQVLRKMMDVPASKWENLTVDDVFARMSPVNVKEAQALVDVLAEKTGGNYHVLGSYIQREALTEVQAETLRSMAEETWQAYIVDENIVNAVESCVVPYIERENTDWAQVARDTAQAIENGM